MVTLDICHVSIPVQEHHDFVRLGMAVNFAVCSHMGVNDCAVVTDSLTGATYRLERIT